VQTSTIAAFVVGIAITFVIIAVALTIFNLLPIPPLDGWRALLGLVDARTAMSLRPFEQYGFVVLILIIVAAPGLLFQLVSAGAAVLLGFSPFV
jgi:Zn-dependent protease